MKTLTAALVAEIRQRSRSGTVTVAALATEYGVSRCAISNAAWGISFAHVPWDGPPQWKYPVGGAARAKLTKRKAQAIRAAYAQGGTTVRKLLYVDLSLCFRDIIASRFRNDIEGAYMGRKRIYSSNAEKFR